MDTYTVKKIDSPVIGNVTVPGSKSVTNRALLMAALADGKSVLKGVLFSDDSRHFLGSLLSLGFDVDINEEDKIVTITGCGGELPNKSGSINVGSAGTAARFLTAMLGLSDGKYVIDASEQMKGRPMSGIFEALTELGADFTYLEKEGFLPVEVTGRNYGKKAAKSDKPATVHVDISKTTQYLSALMMTGSMVKEGLDIHITSTKTDGAYIRITSAMMKDFGCSVSYDGHDYHVPAGEHYNPGDYDIEPDISAACYFWAIAAVTGGSIRVNGVRRNMMQGDIKFLEVLETMGCIAEESMEGITVSAPNAGYLKSVDVNMNDFSDQTMTLAAIAPYADGTTHIRNVGHIRLQESDRINGILTNLRAMGIECGEETDSGKEGIYIKAGKVEPCNIKTFEDHRMAMAFAIAGLKAEGMVIENPMCCRKTFENYFDVFESICYK